MATAKRIIVVGGGIAGIACALRLSERGVPVLLLETRTKLGGRATSFKDVRTGLVIDNCQHVAMGCCTNYLDLCRRLGVADKIIWHREINWVESGAHAGRVSVMRPGILPAPGHFTGSFLGVKFLDTTEKLALASALGALLRTDRSQWRTRTFGDWLKSQDQPPSVIEKFWLPVVVSACNLDVSKVCAATAMHVFQEGFLAHRDSAAMGVSGVPLIELYDPALKAIETAGGEVRLGAGIEKILEDRVLTTSGDWIEADHVVCAVTPERAIKIVDDSIRASDPRFKMIEGITHSPILGVHLVFDRPVMPLPHAVLVGRPTQWLFRKDDRGEKLHAVISGADEWLDLDEDEITRRVLADLHACFPGSERATLLSSRPVKEKLATFAPTPAVEASRPTTIGSSALILAGDYIQTGWPATMEGATRSGYMAAAAILGDSPETLVKPGLTPSTLSRMLMPGA